MVTSSRAGRCGSGTNRGGRNGGEAAARGGAGCLIGLSPISRGWAWVEVEQRLGYFLAGDSP